jgi:hypothetical protein
VPCRAVVADCRYGASAACAGTLWGAGRPYVLAVRPSRGTGGPEDAAHPPEDAAREVPWTSAAQPGGWTRVERHCRDGPTQTWWAADLERAGYGPGAATRLVVATTDRRRGPPRARGMSSPTCRTRRPRPPRCRRSRQRTGRRSYACLGCASGWRTASHTTGIERARRLQVHGCVLSLKILPSCVEGYGWRKDPLAMALLAY